MTTNPRIFETNCFEDWYLYNDSLRKSDGASLIGESPISREFFWQFRPLANRYLSSLNPVFLVEVPGAVTFKMRSVWQIRDGLVPMLWFFRKYPKPADIKSRILVREDLAFAVPAAWSKVLGTYRLVVNHRDNTRPRKQPTKLLLTGLVSESFCTLDGLKTRLAAMEKYFGEQRFAKLEKIVALSIRPDGFLPEDPTRFHLQFMKETCKSIGLDFKAMNLDDVKLVSDWSDSYCHDFNEGGIIADGHLEHMVASKGGILLGANGEPMEVGNLSKDEHYVPLSAYHGMVVRQSAPEIDPKQRPKFDAEIEKIMMSPTNQYYPWPNWLVEWVQEQRKSNQ